MCLWPRPQQRGVSVLFFFNKLKELCCTHTHNTQKSHKNMTLMPCQFFTRIISEDIFIYIFSLSPIRSLLLLLLRWRCCCCCYRGSYFCCEHTHSMQRIASILWNRIIAIRYWNYFVIFFLFLRFVFKMDFNCFGADWSPSLSSPSPDCIQTSTVCASIQCCVHMSIYKHQQPKRYLNEKYGFYYFIWL